MRCKILILLLILIMFCSCTKTSFVETIRNVSNSVVFVECYVNGEIYSTGSGFFIAEDLILTAKHLIHSDNIVVVLYNGDELQVEKILVSNKFDFAVLKVPVTDYIKPVVLDFQDRLRVGESIFIIGTPYGLSFFNSVAEGIISGTNRIVMGQLVNQTSAPVNYGNSGGPVFNKQGRVIGIVVMKVPASDGMGFFIPITLVDVNEVI